jgi:hypothetical protein
VLASADRLDHEQSVAALRVPLRVPLRDGRLRPHPSRWRRRVAPPAMRDDVLVDTGAGRHFQQVHVWFRLMINPERLWSVARPRMARLGGSVTGTVRFVDDAKVVHDPGLGALVRSTDLFSLDDMPSWRPFLEPAPTWLHLSLISGAGIVTVRCSAVTFAGAETAINVTVASTPVWIDPD